MLAGGLGRAGRSSKIRKMALGAQPGFRPYLDTLEQVTYLCHSSLLCELQVLLVPGLWGFVRIKWIASWRGYDSLPMHRIPLINTICDDDHGHHDSDGDGPVRQLDL